MGAVSTFTQSVLTIIWKVSVTSLTSQRAPGPAVPGYRTYEAEVAPGASQEQDILRSSFLTCHTRAPGLQTPGLTCSSRGAVLTEVTTTAGAQDSLRCRPGTQRMLPPPATKQPPQTVLVPPGLGFGFFSQYKGHLSGPKPRDMRLLCRAERGITFQELPTHSPRPGGGSRHAC